MIRAVSNQCFGALVDFGGAEHEGGLLAQAEDGILELARTLAVSGRPAELRCAGSVERSRWTGFVAARGGDAGGI